MTGFQAPNYTQVPNDYFDLIMEMTIAEIKVLSALIRVTLGYHRDEITLSVREMARITNLDPKSVMAGASKLEERGLIERTVGKITTVTKWRVVIGDVKLWEKIVKTVGNDSEVKESLPYNKKKKSKEKEAPEAKPPTPPEVLLFRSVTERYPPKPNFDDVVNSIRVMQHRLQRPATKEDLKPFYAAWCHKGYKPINLSWLEWAETGQIPVNGNWKPRAQEPKAFDAIRQFMASQEAINGESAGYIESNS